MGSYQFYDGSVSIDAGRDILPVIYFIVRGVWSRDRLHVIIIAGGGGGCGGVPDDVERTFDFFGRNGVIRRVPIRKENIASAYLIFLSHATIFLLVTDFICKNSHEWFTNKNTKYISRGTS